MGSKQTGGFGGWQESTNGVATPATTRGRSRFDSVDLLRGLVMVVMALDHTRFCLTSPLVDPTDLSKTTPALFFTRWVTHFCAPTFVFLAGAGAYLYGARHRSRGALAWFLLTRGVWLMLLEVTAVRAAWFFNFDYGFTILQVIWAIGASMIVLAGLVFLPLSAIAALGVALVAFHNLLDGVQAEQLGAYRVAWLLLHEPGFFEVAPGRGVVSGYPLLPWLGVMACGYAFGALLTLPRDVRGRQILGLGAALILLFVALRCWNGYGDPRPWEGQQDNVSLLMSFLNCTKYPPSLSFVLMTLGPAILGLDLFDRPPGPIGRVFVLFGRVPLFYYLLHFAVIHLLAVEVVYFHYGDIRWLFQDPPKPPPGYGFGLPVVYLVWLLAVAMLYWPCLWFAAVKERRRDWWLSYL
jgi:uncharacterized membrane protein